VNGIQRRTSAADALTAMGFQVIGSIDPDEGVRFTPRQRDPLLDWAIRLGEEARAAATGVVDGEVLDVHDEIVSPRKELES